MSSKRDLIIRVMLNHFHQGAPEMVLASLPDGKAKGVLALELTSQDVPHLLNEPKELIQQVHYSWLVPVLQHFPEKMQMFFLSSLPKTKALLLSEMIKKPLHTTKMALPVRLYLLNMIAAKLKPANVLPAPFLPTTNLSPLLNMRKGEIVQLIDFLGLYDLAEEIRHIVDKKQLKVIYSCLSVKKQHFLRICLHQKERLSIPRLGLEKWQGDSKSLDSLLHRRGLLRLGKGMSGQHPDFLWHMMHRLDSGRGRILQQYYSKEEIPGVTQALIQEILNLMNFFKKTSDL